MLYPTKCFPVLSLCEQLNAHERSILQTLLISLHTLPPFLKNFLYQEFCQITLLLCKSQLLYNSFVRLNKTRIVSIYEDGLVSLKFLFHLKIFVVIPHSKS